MTPEETQEMQSALKQNYDIFAWAYSDMKGIDPSIVSHKLNVLPTARPIRQKIRHFHLDRQKIFRIEIDKLLEARFIREVDYPDCFPLPRIDQIVDSTAGQGMLSFLDAFSRYHQIPMSSDDEEKTAFITPHNLYCYRVMPFGLKNAGATYQRLMTKIFKPLIGHTVEVYIDDIVVKSKNRDEHVLHLQEVFHLLRKYGMKLNPSKCAFGISIGKFLGFMVSQKGIEVSPDQVKTVIETPPPRTKKELQRLTAAHPKQPHPKRKIIHVSGCIGVGNQRCSIRCPSPKEQKPIYYVSRALADVETWYSKIELTALALRSTAQKLRPYFQAHPVVVLTDQPLRQVMADFVLEYSRRLSQRKESSEKEWWILRVDGASRSSGSGSRASAIVSNRGTLGASHPAGIPCLQQ
ncbi:Retrovirus-related Pol polyprotein from transposon opus [Vitis vinifera]|uniref:Retrovirus-related Pol polyprotein from transposon opus n=1 Tax=Vitis vinifera TaxID=29760 RepID=A0A438KDQ8_VITVI|nr:Retrovirus-related Pol polyprotein from transposon opus [Vitis vinifera]